VRLKRDIERYLNAVAYLAVVTRYDRKRSKFLVVQYPSITLRRLQIDESVTEIGHETS
jgi:hypothetical protein